MGSCNLPLQSPGRGGGQTIVLSWLLRSGCISLGDMIQFRARKANIVVKEGFITLGGIFCKCCNKVVSLFEFKRHAGFRVNRACLYLFMESGKPFALCQLEAWSAEYKAKKGACVMDQNEEVDDGDDYCGCCGNDGDLIYFDNCPSAFHHECLYIKEIPDENWYCPQCTCQIYSNGMDKKEVLLPREMLKCIQCQNHCLSRSSSTNWHLNPSF